MLTKTKRILDMTAKVETRKDEGGKMFIDGLIPFNLRSEEMWDFVEVIDPTAFNKTIADGSNVYAFWAHDDSQVLASRDAGTLALAIEPLGLRFTAELRDGCADNFAAVQRGDVIGVSFGFITQKEEWDFAVEPAVRTLKEVQLLEVSPGVAFPAYPGAQSAAAMRSIVAEMPHIIEVRSSHVPASDPKTPEKKTLEPTPEQRDALESRSRAELELAVIRGAYL